MEKHGLELEILTMLNFDSADPRPMGFDAGIEFAPLTHYRHPGFDKKKSRIPLLLPDKLIDLDFSGYIADYRAFLTEETRGFDFPTYTSVAPAWDNEARKKGKGSLTLYGSNPDMYGEWLEGAISDSKAKDKNLVFINAWNEWAEGTTLEPTAHAGYAVLNRTTEVLAKYSKNSINKRRFPLYGYKKTPGAKLAIVVHLFYQDRWEYLRGKLDALGDIEFDLFVTVTKSTENVAPEIKDAYPKAHIIPVANRGRDILPFLFVVNRIRNLGYEYVLKLHSKKSKHRDDGDEWFKDLVNGLLPSTNAVKAIVMCLEKGAAIVGPAGHYISLRTYLGSDKKRLLKYVEEAYEEPVASNLLAKDRGYFAGSMFWARLDGLEELLNFRLIPEDFEAEKGQIDGTLAHTVERLVSLLPELGNRPVYSSSALGLKRVNESDILQDYIYARKNNKGAL
jgi:lipopolysaccharide biosynthesis protein